MSDFINSTINTKIYNMMQDEHQIITIIDKEAEVKDIGTIVSGDTNSCLLTFEINRFQDGIDLSDKKIRFNYRNSNGKFYDIAVNVKYNDDVIRFSWLLPYSLTQPGGNVIASIDFYGSIEYGEQYSYKTKNFKLSVEKSLGVDDGSDESYNNWAIKIENSVESIQNKIGEIEKDIKAIYVPTKLSEMADDAEHRTVSDSQIESWNNKSEFDGQYSSLQGIPEDIATETYVDEKIAILENEIDTNKSASDTNISNLNTKIDNTIIETEEKIASAKAEINGVINTNKTETDTNITNINLAISTLETKVEENITELSDEISTEAIRVNNELEGKVDKIIGKGLSTNDYSNEEKIKLEGLSNYDDSLLTNKITSLESEMSDLKSSIASVQEINNYLQL